MIAKTIRRASHAAPLDEPRPFPPGTPATPPGQLLAVLSEREEEIARLVSRGFSNKEIGKHLGISHWTVSTHLRRIFIKLEITRRIELCLLVSRASAADRTVEAVFEAVPRAALIA